MTPTLLVLAVAALAPSSGPPVETVERAVARLSSASGRPVAVSRALRRLPVLVDAPGLAPGATLRTLALALHASLVDDGRTLRLERTAADRKAVDAAGLAARKERIEAALAKLDGILKRAEGYGDAAAQVRQAHAEVVEAARKVQEAAQAGRTYASPPGTMGEFMVTPASRLARGIVARLGFDRLADPGPLGVRFYSNRPNAAELPLPGCGDLLDAYKSVQAGYATAMDLPTTTPPAKAVLSIVRGGANLDLYDVGGKRIDHGVVFLDAVPVASSGDPDRVPGPDASWVPLDEPARRMTAFFGPNLQNARLAALPPEFLRPERFDPLDFCVRAGVLKMARAPGAPALVAVLSDAPSVWAEGFARDGQFDVVGFARRLLGTGGYERLAQGGATIVRPKDEAEAEARLTDRSALGTALRRVVEARGIRIPDWCALHLALYANASAVSDRYVNAVKRMTMVEGFHAFVGYTAHSDLEFALVGAALGAGVPVADAATPPFDDLIARGIARGMAFEGGPALSDLARAPSTLLAALRGTRVALATSESPVAQSYGGPAPAAGRFGGDEAEGLGARLAFMQTVGPKRTRNETSDRQFVKLNVLDAHYALGRREKTIMDVLLADGRRHRVEFRDDRLDRAGLAFSDLPQSFQEGVMRGVERALDNPPDTSRPGTGYHPSADP